MPNHKFEDPTYDQQRALLAENQEDALQQGKNMKYGALFIFYTDQTKGSVVIYMYSLFVCC